MNKMIERNGKKYPRPTLQQSIDAWCVLNDLIELGVPHNFQHEAPHIRSYMYKVGYIVQDAIRIKEQGKMEEENHVQDTSQ